MRYLDGISAIPLMEADNPLIVGQALHTGIEQGLEAGIQEYYFSFPIITDEHINEAMKLETVIPKAQAAIPPGGEFEVEISDKDFHGFIDYLVPVEQRKVWHDAGGVNSVTGESFEYYTMEGTNEFDLYDFKYSNNITGYKESKQLHLYKYFFERNNPGKHIRNMYFVFVPKVAIQQKKTETLQDFRNRLTSELDGLEVKTVQIQFDAEKVIEFVLKIKAANEETEFTAANNFLCRRCEMQEFCEKGRTYMLKLPENKRRNIEQVKKRVIWIYGAPFCGKTTFANSFPDPLMLNTDGNIKFVDAPYIRIRDEVKVEGRQTKRTFAWEVFKDAVDELEKKENTFKTIVVDLLEDTYEYCRLYMYNKLNITHESDDSFRAWDKVRGEFLNTLKRLVNLDYENIILISHEDTTKDITKRGGDKITAIKPNLQDKVAVKVAGMVDVVARIVADGDSRSFCFKADEVTFGGGRLKVVAKDIPLDVNALFAVYDEANQRYASGDVAAPTASKSTRRSARREESPATASYTPQDKPEDTAEEIIPPEAEAPQNAAESESEATNPPRQEGIPEDFKEALNNSEKANEEPVAEKSEQTETPRRRRKARE